MDQKTFESLYQSNTGTEAEPVFRFVHCRTNKSASAFLSLAGSFGFTWIKDREKIGKETLWQTYGIRTGYIVLKDKTIGVSTIAGKKKNDIVVQYPPTKKK